MKLQNVFISTLLMLAISSCNQNDEMTLNENALQNPEVSGEAIMNEQKVLNTVADILVQLPLNEENVSEVHSAVTSSLNYGIDEDYYFREILDNSKYSKIVSKSASTRNEFSSLGELMKKYVLSASTRTEKNDEIDLNSLAESDIQIYWPYSENWDGKSMPVITFTPEDENQEWNYGYIKNGEKIDTIIINEDYAEQHPVWIISKSDISYDNLPEFSKNEFIKNDISFLTTEDSKTKNEPLLMASSSSNVYTVYLGQIKSTKQYDSIWAGGSEFIFQMGSASNYQFSNGSLISFNPLVTHHRICVSRKKIRKKRWVNVNQPIVPDWIPNLTDVAFLLIEDDGGSNKNITQNLAIALKDKNVDFNVTLTLKSHDELIHKNTYSHNYIFSDNNNLSGDNNNPNWFKFTSGGVYWTFPYKIGTRIGY